jgi:hypothetical protein
MYRYTNTYIDQLSILKYTSMYMCIYIHILVHVCILIVVIELSLFLVTPRCVMKKMVHPWSELDGVGSHLPRI